MSNRKKVTILEIDEKNFISHILNKGAIKQDEFLQRRFVYDFNN